MTQTTTCQCDACMYSENKHNSDCAVHNMPAMPNGPCDCRLDQVKDGKKFTCQSCGSTAHSYSGMRIADGEVYCEHCDDNGAMCGMPFISEMVQI